MKNRIFLKSLIGIIIGFSVGWMLGIRGVLGMVIGWMVIGLVFATFLHFDA